MAATGLPAWTLGKDLISFTITGVVVTAVAPDGTHPGGSTTFTPDAPSTECKGIVRRLGDRYNIATRDIRPITEVQENQVPVSTANSLSITNIRIMTNASGTTLSNIVTGSGSTSARFYVQVIFQDSHEQWDGYYVITSYEAGFDGIEEQVQSMELGPVALSSRGQVVRTLIP